MTQTTQYGNCSGRRLAGRRPLVAYFLLTIPLCLVAADERHTQSALGKLEIWNDGLSEMCYYDATRTIYGQARKYTRVHLLNREWLDPTTGVKTDNTESPAAQPVFKLNITEQIPTPNYNYRLMTTVFLDRRTLEPLKTVCSTQEWCGVTYKHLRWSETGLNFKSFSYWENEAEQESNLDRNVWPFEALFLLAREYVVSGTVPEVAGILPTLRSNRAVKPDPLKPVKFEKLPAAKLRVPAGTFEAAEIKITIADYDYRIWVETAAPHRVLKFKGKNETGELRFTERRPYWDRASISTFHAPNRAP